MAKRMVYLVTTPGGGYLGRYMGTRRKEGDFHSRSQNRPFATAELFTVEQYAKAAARFWCGDKGGVVPLEIEGPEHEA